MKKLEIKSCVLGMVLGIAIMQPYLAHTTEIAYELGYSHSSKFNKELENLYFDYFATYADDTEMQERIRDIVGGLDSGKVWQCGSSLLRTFYLKCMSETSVMKMPIEIFNGEIPHDALTNEPLFRN